MSAFASPDWAWADAPLTCWGWRPRRRIRRSSRSATSPRRGASAAKEKFAPGGKDYLDYREVLGRNDIDAVVIGAPDHWHVPMTVDAVKAGKDVYVEKPISHTIEEGERVEKAVLESKQIVQVGYQQRSWPHFLQAREIVAGGQAGADLAGADVLVSGLRGQHADSARNWTPRRSTGSGSWARRRISHSTRCAARDGAGSGISAAAT